MRAVELCPHLDPVGARGGPACRLVAAILESDSPGYGAVDPGACRACCAGPVPDRRRPGPVVASLLARAAEEVLLAGGIPGCDAARASDLRWWAHHQLPLVPASVASGEGVGPGRTGRGGRSFAVVIACHNHGRFLGEAIESALAQTLRPDEVLVVDDASTDETEEVARRYQPRGVGYLRVDFRSVYRARSAGLGATGSEILCFLDADDILPADYLERALPLFDRAEVGIAYPDLECFGEQEGRRTFPEFDPDLLELRNYMPACSLVRRRALELADAFREPDVRGSSDDWIVWRRVVDAGWSAAKHPSALRYRRHPPGQPTLSSESIGRPYFDEGAFRLADVTIVIPLSGRAAFWPACREWLAGQAWPRERSHLFLVDSSGDAEFGRAVRGFLAACDYPSTRYLALDVAEPGLADRPRLQNAEAVNLACARIYNRIAREVVTPFILIVEDDILPPAGVIERLLRAMDSRTAAVAAPYRSRFHDAYVAWDDRWQHYRSGEGVTSIGGCGFGCLLVRRAAFAGETFHFGFGEADWFDHAYCRRLRLAGWTIKMDWTQACIHRETS